MLGPSFQLHPPLPPCSFPPVSKPIPWAALRRAMLPLDGSIHDIAPEIVSAFAAIVPRRDWPALTYADLTAGSCLLPLAFAAGGAGTVRRSRRCGAGAANAQFPFCQRLSAAGRGRDL